MIIKTPRTERVPKIFISVDYRIWGVYSGESFLLLLTGHSMSFTTWKAGVGLCPYYLNWLGLSSKIIISSTDHRYHCLLTVE